MIYTDALRRPRTRTASSDELMDELHAMVRDARLADGDESSLRAAFVGFAGSARRAGILPERVVIALKHVYHALVPAIRFDQKEQLAKLITLSIEAYYCGADEDGEPMPYITR